MEAFQLQSGRDRRRIRISRLQISQGGEGAIFHAALGLGRVKTFRPRETGDAKLNLACCRNCELESTWFAWSAVCDLVAPMRTPMPTPHLWIAAMRGFTPRMFMTRV